jgi:UDP-glucose 4-epimerase
MNCIVTGGAGFIGSHLVDRLLKDGHHVIVIDNLYTGKKENLSKNPKLEFYNISICNNISRYMVNVDLVFHFAALTKPQWSILNPEESHKVNVDGTFNVLYNSAKYGVKRVVFASSAAIYGETETLPSVETQSPNPISPYGLHKLIAEQYCTLFEKIYGLETNCLRFFNPYGKRMDILGEYAGAVPIFIDQVKNNKVSIINGDGEQTRDHIYIDDVIDSIIIAANSEVHGEVFNIGSGYAVSVNDIYKLVCKAFNKEPNCVHGPALPEPRVTLANIYKAEVLLGWKPKVSFAEGLERIIWT